MIAANYHHPPPKKSAASTPCEENSVLLKIGSIKFNTEIVVPVTTLKNDGFCLPLESLEKEEEKCITIYSHPEACF